MYQAIFIDADNTLFDFDRTQHLSISECLDHFQLPSHPEAIDFYNEVNRDAWRRYNEGEIASEAINIERWRPWLQKYDPDQRHCAQAVAARYADNLAQQCEKEAGAERLMTLLLQHWPVHIITNGFSSTQKHRWHLSGWHAHLSGITVSAEVGVKKPEPEIFHIAMAAVGVTQPEKCLMIGDSLQSDIAGAHSVGMKSCWYQRNGEVYGGHIEPDITVTHLDQLTEQLTQLVGEVA